MKIPIRYIPYRLTKKDKDTQKQMLLKSRRLYKKGKYYTRKSVSLSRSQKVQQVWMLGMGLTI